MGRRRERKTMKEREMNKRKERNSKYRQWNSPQVQSIPEHDSTYGTDTICLLANEEMCIYRFLPNSSSQSGKTNNKQSRSTERQSFPFHPTARHVPRCCIPNPKMTANANTAVKAALPVSCPVCTHSTREGRFCLRHCPQSPLRLSRSTENKPLVCPSKHTGGFGGFRRPIKAGIILNHPEPMHACNTCLAAVLVLRVHIAA